MTTPKVTREKLKLERPRIEKIEKPPRGTRWPDFDSMFQPQDDPLDGLEDTGDLEANADMIMSRVAEVFIEDEGRKLDEYRTMVNQDFYLVVCFQSEDQKLDFLDKAGWADLGNLYIDGIQVAKRLSLDVPPVPLATKEPKRIPRPLRVLPILRRGGDTQ